MLVLFQEIGPHHAYFLNHLAQDESRILLHSRRRILAGVGVFGSNEYLGDPRDDHQAEDESDHQLDQAEAPGQLSHGVTTGSVPTRLVNTKVRVGAFAVVASSARLSPQPMVIVTTRLLTAMLPLPSVAANVVILFLKS